MEWAVQEAANCPRLWWCGADLNGLSLERLLQMEPQHSWVQTSLGPLLTLRSNDPLCTAPCCWHVGMKCGLCLTELSFDSFSCFTALLSPLQQYNKQDDNKGCGFGNSALILLGENSYGLNVFHLI